MAQVSEVVRTTLLTRPDKLGLRGIVFFEGAVEDNTKEEFEPIGTLNPLSGEVCIRKGLNKREQDTVMLDVEAALAFERRKDSEIVT